MEFLQNNAVMILMALLAISEVLALIPSIKANSIFQFIFGALKFVIEKMKGQAK